MSSELNPRRILREVELMYSDPKVYENNKPYPVELSLQDVSFWQRRLKDDFLLFALRRHRARRFHDFSYLKHGVDLVEIVKERFLPISGQSLSARVEVDLSRREMGVLDQLFLVSQNEKQSGHISEDLPYVYMSELKDAFAKAVRKKDHPSKLRNGINNFFKR